MAKNAKLGTRANPAANALTTAARTSHGRPTGWGRTLPTMSTACSPVANDAKLGGDQRRRHRGSIAMFTWLSANRGRAMPITASTRSPVAEGAKVITPLPTR